MTKTYDYELVYNFVLDLINTTLDEHDKIPSENELCKEFNLSRLTVRQGINKLKSEGYLYSRQGSGNFVSPKKIVYKISPYTTFSNEIRKSKKEPSIKILETRIIKADEEIAKHLGIKEAEKVFYMKNMRLVDGVPFLYAEYYLNLFVLEGLEKHLDNLHSFSELYKNYYGLKPIRDYSEIDITSTNYNSKKLFEVQNDLPIIKIATKTTDTITKQSIDFCYSYFRSDLAKIVVDYKEYTHD